MKKLPKGTQNDHMIEMVMPHKELQSTVLLYPAGIALSTGILYRITVEN